MLTGNKKGSTRKRQTINKKSARIEAGITLLSMSVCRFIYFSGLGSEEMKIKLNKNSK